MPKDFSAKQIRVSQLIASGAISGTHASIAIYSASDASNLEGGYSATSMFKGVGDDVFLFVSGTVDGRGRTGTTHPGNITLFGGDVVVSGTFYTEKLVAEIDATSTGSLSISGSAYIQHGLFVSGADGRNMHILAPSLFDGNMHISGNVSDFALTGTIKNTAAKIVESSVATEIETDAGSLTLDGKTGVNLQANGTTVLSVGPAGTYLSSSVSDFALTGTIKNSASKIIESSVATEIETDAGALTLDGKTGINLQANGTTVLSVGPAGTYLSSSVSDFALTGTIKNSAAKVIESSVATEIETDAGALTLDGKTGINLQENGTTVIAIDDQRNVSIGVGATKGLYLSSSVSDFALTGTIKNSATKVIESSVETEIETAAGALTLDGRTGVILQTSGSMLMSVGSGSIYISGSVSDFALSGTIKNTAAKVIESAVATEIETTAGSLTLDGKTGVNLQANGTTVLSAGPGGTYLSSSVSDFTLTGTIKNSASKVIESSVATEIETTAGSLTLDGKTGINLQENGTTLIALDNGQNVIIGTAGKQIQLSGSVSDFALTGTIKSSASKVIESSVATEIESTGSLTLDGASSVALQANGTQILAVSPSGVYLSGSVSDFSLSGTIKNSASKIIESSVATEIETAAGSLTLDGKTGVSLQTNGTTMLSVGPSGVYISGSVSGLEITGTIRSSAAKIIESSVATEIETDSGALTLDGKTGVNLQANGATVLSVGPAGTYLSSSVSDFALTGTIKNSAAKVIESSVATEIETDAGSLTLDGKTGINLQEDGTTVISIDNQRNVNVGVTGQGIYLSGTLSDYALSGTIKNSASKVIKSSVATEIESTGSLTLDGASSVALQANGTTVLSVGPAGTYLSGSVSDFALTGTIKNSASKVIESSVATEIETDAGALTLDGKTGINLQANGTTVLSIGTAGTYLSSSVSDFALTGTIKNSASKVIESSVATEIETAAGALTVDGKTGVSLQANGTTVLSVGPAGTYLSGSVSDFSLTGTIKNSAAKIIESSVATEIETDAGALTLDGKTGVNLQANGTTIISVGPAGMYLSSSVSDFSLTGTIKNSAAKVIESSVATEIETAIGTLTLDGAAGVDLQHSGSSYIKLNSGSITIGDLSGSNTLGVAPPDIYVSGAIQSELHLSGSVFADKLSGSLTTLANGNPYLVGHGGLAITTGSDGSVTLNLGAASNAFGTVAVSGQDDVVADQSGDTITFAAAQNMAITTNATSDTITFTGIAGGGSSTVFNDRGHKATSTGSLSIAGPGHGLTYDATSVGADVFFFVSGTAGSRNTSNTGSAVFGGDVIVSGTFYAEKIVAEIDATSTGSLSISGSAYIQQGLLVSGAHGRNMHILAPSLFDGNMHISGAVSDFALTGTIKNSATKIIESSVATEIETDAGILTLDGKTGINLQEDGTTVIAIDDQRNVSIGAGITNGLYLSSSLSDFALTGTIKNSASKVIESSVATEIESTGSLTLDGASSVSLQANGTQILAVSPSGVYLSGSVSDFRITGSIKIDTSTALEAPATTVIKTLGGSWDIDGKTGVNLQTNGTTMLSVGPAGVYISGSVSGLEITGTIRNSAAKIIESSVATEIETTAGALTLDGKTGVALQVNGTQMLSVGPKGVYLSGSVSDFLATGTIKSDASVALEATAGTTIKTLGGPFSVDGESGVELQYSGSTYIKLNSGSIVLGDLSGTTTLGVAPPNIYVSGAILSPLHVSGSVFADKLSGSLTTLADGTEYMIAGTNITINTGSSGALTISATTGTADPGGGNTEVQFNDGGDFGGDPGFSFNKTAGLLSVVRLATEFSAHFSGSVSDFNLTGTIKNSASKVIESSVATEIESTGSLTLDGASSVALQANGAQILAISPSGVYLSGSVSSLNVTGTLKMTSDVLPSANNTYNLGSDTVRWANVYTSDLHLKNERGNWTIVEEEDYLCVVNNRTGKRFKMMLEEIEE